MTEEICTRTNAKAEPITAESMLKIFEQLRRDTPACWCSDFVTSDLLPKSTQGVTYACTQCFKLFTAPKSLVGDDPPRRLSINFMGDIVHVQ